jgi:hypothetical protein
MHFRFQDLGTQSELTSTRGAVVDVAEGAGWHESWMHGCMDDRTSTLVHSRNLSTILLPAECGGYGCTLVRRSRHCS